MKLKKICLLRGVLCPFPLIFCKQLTTVFVNAVPVADPMSRPKGPTGDHQLANFTDKFFFLFHVVFIAPFSEE